MVRQLQSYLHSISLIISTETAIGIRGPTGLPLTRVARVIPASTRPDSARSAIPSSAQKFPAEDGPAEDRAG